MVKPTLLIISDIFGFDKNDFLHLYIKQLKSQFTIIKLDSREISQIATNLNVTTTHNQFLSYGIEKGANYLLSNFSEIHSILSFSIGGILAWRAGLKGLKFDNLISVSTTRLRFENQIPNGNIELYFGNNDEFRPKENWISGKNMKVEIIEDQEHEMYKQKNITNLVCKRLIAIKNL